MDNGNKREKIFTFYSIQSNFLNIIFLIILI